MPPRLRVLAFVPYRHDTVPGQRFRIEQWARRLETRAHFTFLPFESQRLKTIIYQRGQHAEKALEIGKCIVRRLGDLWRHHGSHDVVLVYREAAPLGPPLLERAIKTLGLPIVYDFDDAIFIPSVSPENRAFQWLKFAGKTDSICRMCTSVIVGNPFLKEYAEAFCDDVHIVPTTIDTDAYRPRASNAISGVPVIGWSGSLTTAAYLRGAVPMLQRLRRRVEFRLSVVGAGADFKAPGIEVESKPWSAATEIADISAFDVGLMPLTEDRWAKGKCGLKTLQYMALGVPSVSSPVGVNSDIVRDGVNGFLAATDSEWLDKLVQLLADEGLRRRIAAEGRRTVEGRYSAAVQAPRFLEILEAAASSRVAGARGEGSPTPQASR